MQMLLSLVIGLLYAAGIYMILRRSFVKLVIGLLMVGHATNLLIFTSAGLVRGKPPLIDPGLKALGGETNDPLAPALILTAIVISFAVVSYTIVLVKRTYQEVGTDDLREMRTTDR